MTKIQQYRQIIEAELDAGRPVPTNGFIARAMGRNNASTRHYGLGGRYTYEKQKIKIERGIASPTEVRAFQSKDGTYGPMSEAAQQRAVIAELKDRGAWFRG